MYGLVIYVLAWPPLRSLNLHHSLLELPLVSVLLNLVQPSNYRMNKNSVESRFKLIIISLYQKILKILNTNDVQANHNSLHWRILYIEYLMKAITLYSFILYMGKSIYSTLIQLYIVKLTGYSVPRISFPMILTC